MYIYIYITSRPLYGGGTRFCVYFVYVYILFCFVGLLWMSLELILPVLQHSHCKNKATPYQTLLTNLLEIYQTPNKHTMQTYHKLIKTAGG